MKPILLSSTLLILVLGSSIAAAGEPPLESALKAFEKGEFERVLSLCDAVPQDSPDHPKARYLAGETLLVLGRHPEAEKAFRAVLAVKPRRSRRGPDSAARSPRKVATTRRSPRSDRPSRPHRGTSAHSVRSARPSPRPASRGRPGGRS